jgi:hypothetical protein
LEKEHVAKYANRVSNMKQAFNDMYTAIRGKLTSDESNELFAMVGTAVIGTNYDKDNLDSVVKKYVESNQVSFKKDFDDELVNLKKLFNVIRDIATGDFNFNLQTAREAALAATLVYRAQYPKDKLALAKEKLRDLDDVYITTMTDTSLDP